MKEVIGCFLILVVSAAIDLIVAWALWLIYNDIAPTFHWPLVAYWTMFLITLGLMIIGQFFRSPSSSSSSKK